MKKLLFPFLLVLLLFSSSNSHAHALWIKTATTGNLNSPHKVSVYYAEPQDKHEQISDWWSNTAEFELWLVAPNGKKTKLQLQKGANEFTANFVPNENGEHKLYIHHVVAQLAGKTQYEFNASALVNVGGATAKGVEIADDSTNPLYLKDISQKKGDINLLLTSGNQAVKEAGLTIFAPNGWKKEVATNDQGQATVTVEWPGEYLLEGSVVEKAEGKDYDKKVKIITLLTNVAL